LQNTFGGDESKDAVVLAVELAPGSSMGRHTHPDDCKCSVACPNGQKAVARRGPRRTWAPHPHICWRAQMFRRLPAGASGPQATIATDVVAPVERHTGMETPWAVAPCPVLCICRPWRLGRANESRLAALLCAVWHPRHLGVEAPACSGERGYRVGDANAGGAN